MSFMSGRKEPPKKSPEVLRMEAIQEYFNSLTSKILKQDLQRAIEYVRKGFEGKFYEQNELLKQIGQQ